MRNLLVASSTPLLILGTVMVSALIVWLSRPDEMVHTGQPAPVAPRTAKLHEVDRPTPAWQPGRPDQGVGLYPQAEQALELLADWLRDNSEAVKSPEPLGGEAGATSG
jgi:hypothetical protein